MAVPIQTPALVHAPTHTSIIYSADNYASFAPSKLYSSDSSEGEDCSESTASTRQPQTVPVPQEGKAPESPLPTSRPPRDQVLSLLTKFPVSAVFKLCHQTIPKVTLLYWKRRLNSGLYEEERVRTRPEPRVYSERLKREVWEMLRTQPLATVFDHYSGHIPYCTLYQWQQKVRRGESLKLRNGQPARDRYDLGLKKRVFELLKDHTVSQVYEICGHAVGLTVLSSWKRHVDRGGGSRRARGERARKPRAGR